MVFENIYQLQRNWTDKYVVVDESRPELKRFGGMTGRVKTVNFSGRALVEFDANNNIGWFDIDPQFLKVIDAPLPKPEKKAPAKAEKPAPAKAEKPVAKPAAAPAAGGGASVADILAAARAGSKPAAGTPAAPEAEAKPAAAKPAAEGAKVDPAKMSVADMLAMARGKKPVGDAPPAAAAVAQPPAPEPEEVEPEAPEPVAEQEPEPQVETATPAAAPGKLNRESMSVAEMIDYCRKADAS